MKYLHDYMTEAQTELFKKTGTIFAFSDKQFLEQKKENTDYINLGSGMITPRPYRKEVLQGLREIHRKGMAQDLRENGKVGIIKRELNNHEAFYTNDPTQTIETLEDYPGISRADILKVYQEMWQKILK